MNALGTTIRHVSVLTFAMVTVAGGASRSGTVNGIGLTARQSSLGWSDKTLATTHRR